MKANLLAPLLEGLLDAVWLVDPLELRILMANQAAESMLGVARGGLAGKAVIDLVSTPEDVFFWEDVAAGRSDQILSETMLNRPDGATLRVERRVSRMQVDHESMYVVAIRDYSDQRRVENELEHLIAELRATLESTADGILVIDPAGNVRGFNQRFAELWDLPEHLLTRRDDTAVFAWMSTCVLDADRYVERLAVIARSPLIESTDVLMLKTGKVLERVTLPQYARSRPIGRVYSFRDITQRLADEQRLQLAAKVFESSLDAIFVTDPERHIIAVNPRCEVLTGYTRDEMGGRSPTDFMASATDVTLVDQIKHGLDHDGFWEGEVWCRRKTGESYPSLMSLVRVLDADGKPVNCVGFFKDLTESLEAKRRIEELAYNDSLTGLPNRLLLNERMAQAMHLCERNGLQFAILFLDLDRFKHINDSLGHVFGDRVLVEVAERLKICLRSVDTAARLGGDEFVVLLNQVDPATTELIARRVLETLSRPITFDELSFTVTCSIGVALYPSDGKTLDELIKNADSAMYYVKERGRSDFRFYQRQMNVGLLSRMKLDHAMRLALANDGFSLHYQPQIEIRSGQVIGVEALLRWTDPELGVVPPGQFIPIAEETGVIVPIGNWVLEEAIHQAARWHDGGRTLPVAVNVSALQFQQVDFVARVGDLLQQYGLPPRLLELELTESILIRDANDALKRLEGLAALGVRLSIDDFGTGYSSLAYLKRFPISKLKIDRSFVKDVPGDEGDEGIVEAIIQMARALRLKVVAEGVEQQHQADYLMELGCDHYQGYLFSPAQPPGALEQLLQEYTPG
ncbi:EAL domain-containing protein [Chitinivorax sp. PXF-14]|uniref:sensor domain-containing protein n=1 Tax=Chitinivorax sp. PXF-14 TaxID=3230488 RepID=UPI0034678927